jgi:hypothetical protein
MSGALFPGVFPGVPRVRRGFVAEATSRSGARAASFISRRFVMRYPDRWPEIAHCALRL